MPSGLDPAYVTQYTNSQRLLAVLGDDKPGMGTAGERFDDLPPLLRPNRLTVWPCWFSPHVGDSVRTVLCFYLVMACFLFLLLLLPLYLYHSARGGTAPSHV